MSVLRIKLSSQLDPSTLGDDAALLDHGFRHALVDRAGAAPLDGALASMPSANTLEILLPASAVRVVRAKVPRVSGAALRRVLPNLVEDSVVGEVAECHLVVLPGLHEGGLRDIAVVDRLWMRLVQRMVQLRRARRAVVVSEAMLAPRVPFIAIDDGRGYLRHAKGVLPFVVPDGLEPPAELRLGKALLGDHETTVEIAGLDADRAGFWAQSLGIGLDVVAWQWAQAPAVDPAWTLLQYEYARGGAAGNSSLRAWRWTIGLAGACALAAIVGINLDWLAQLDERASLRHQINAEFAAAFPNITTVVDPIRQAQRQVALATGGADEPFLALSGALASAVGDAAGAAAAVRSLEFRAGSLRARLAPGTQADQVAERARARGVEASTEPAGPDGAPVVVIRKKP